MGTQSEHKIEIATVAMILESLETTSIVESNQALAHIDKPGARLSKEFEQYPSFIYPFPHQWPDQQKARQWAFSILNNQPTFAVDAEQIYPVKNTNESTAYIQVGSIENPHDTCTRFTKDVHGKIMSGEEILPPKAGPPISKRDMINWHCLRLMIERLVIYMKKQALANTKPVCFFDGPLILSFIQHMHPDHQKPYTELIRHLLKTSEEMQVPLIGYIEESHATDLVAMASHLSDLWLFTSLSDAKVFQGCAQKWGDRSRSHICARRDRVIDAYYDEIGFVYLRFNNYQPPARIEFPKWLIEAGILEEMMDVVRAECILGLGFPKILAAAYALATITPEEDSLFKAILDELIEED
jgi:hypothetical protein